MVRAVLPAPLLRRRDERYRTRLRSRLGVVDLAQDFYDRWGGTVRSGPFQGLRYPTDDLPAIDAPIAKLLGTYECEIGSIVASSLESARLFVNVGAADGYYAVGAAHRFPSLAVIAFEINREARRRCQRLAAFNDVEGNLEVRAACNTNVLASLPLDYAFVLSDCEGAEVDIFKPVAVAACRRAVVLVELHGPEAVTALTTKFAPTHDAQLIEARPRQGAAFPELAHLSVDDSRLALSEIRPDVGTWGVFRPRTT